MVIHKFLLRKIQKITVVPYVWTLGKSIIQSQMRWRRLIYDICYE